MKARTLAAMVLSVLSSAHAQQADRQERIEVTGSRIAASDTESASPIAVIRAEEIRLDGYPFLELILNTFPQLVPEQGNRLSNGASGTSTLDLRGLGSHRTLVLLNGRRLPAGSPLLLAPDINQIPAPLVERVEILTGGASAVYGSDAIAGVVNFILKDRFEGVQGDVAYDFYGHRQKNAAIQNAMRARGFEVPGDKSRDGETTSASLALGGNFAGGKGNATLFMRHVSSDALLQSERDYSACALNLSLQTCQGSNTSYPGRFLDLGPVLNTLPGPPANWTVADERGSVRRFAPATDPYNFAPLNYFQRPIERYGFNAFAHYDFSADHRLYAEFGFHDEHTLAQIAPSGIFFAVDLFAIRYENPLLSADWRRRLIFRNASGEIATGPGTVATMIIGRRNVEGGGRVDDLRHTSYRNVLALRGLLRPHWDYDVYGQTARVLYQERYLNDFSKTRYRRALDVVTDPATGRPVCASVIDGSDRECVPYDIWRLGGVTQEALSYLQTPGSQTGSVSQTIFGATVTGDLGAWGIRVPRTRAGIELAFGAERRRERLAHENDVAFTSYDLAGQSEPSRDIHGTVTSKDVFVEVRVPVLDVLGITSAYRRSDYGGGKVANTFGVGFNAEPARFVRLRGSMQRAIRAPNLQEVFKQQYEGGYGLGPEGPGDPCAGPSPAASLAECQRTGVTAAQYGRIPEVPFGGYPATLGGNPALDFERGTTITAGAALTAGRFSATLDYFDIRLEDTISFNIDAELIFRQCLATGEPRFCRLVTRDPAFGSLWLPGANVLAIAQNIGKTEVSGADISFTYRLPLGRGHALSVNAIGTWLRKWSQEPYPGAEPLHCAGRFGGGAGCFRPMPKWRHRARLEWTTPWSVEAAVTWRHIGATRRDDDALSELRAMDYIDVALAWHARKQLTLRAGVSNVADRDPPMAFSNPPYQSGNIFPQLHDALGRHFFLSATARF